MSTLSSDSRDTVNCFASSTLYLITTFAESGLGIMLLSTHLKVWE